MAERTYQVEVLVEVKLDGTEEDAYALVDNTMQRAWDTDNGRNWARPWHFSMLEGCVADITDDETEPDDEPV